MKQTLLLLMLAISTIAFAQKDKKAAVTAASAEPQTEKLVLNVGDKFSALGLEGKLFDLYNASGGEACKKNDNGKVLSAAVAYIEFKYEGKKVSTELCYQRVAMEKGDKEGKEYYSTESYKAKDGILSLTITDIKEKEGLVTLVITKMPPPVEKK